MKPTFKIFPRIRSVKQNDEIPFYLRLTINRRSRWFTLNTSFLIPDLIKKPGEKLWPDPDKSKYWDSKTVQVKSYPNVNKHRLKQVNQELEKINTKAGANIHQFNINDKALTFDDFETQCWSDSAGIDTKSFYEFATKEIEYMKKVKSPPETIRTFSSLVSKLKKYREPLYFEDITLDFLREYHAHMIVKQKNKENTCSKTFRFIRNMINRAINQKILTENVFDRFTIKSVPGQREFLTEIELKALENLLNKGTGEKHLDNVLRYFLFSCYTGLRYQDIKKLRFQDMKKESTTVGESWIIRVLMHKTGEPVSIPIISRAKELIGEAGFENQKVFKVRANQVTNRHLKDIIAKTEIQKTITFHCARHTFATHCLNLGIPIEVVSSLLGHTDLKTTKVYAKVVDNLKLHHLSKWK